MLALDFEEINIHVDTELELMTCFLTKPINDMTKQGFHYILVCLLTRTGGDVSYSWYCLIRASRVS